MNFRRTILAMALLALCCGLASAQVIIGPVTNQLSGPITCTANVAVPNQLRSEGMTELIGDIVIQCTGGQPLPQGSVIPTANITVSLATNVTSRLYACSTGVGNCSDATLLIDEPQTAGSAGAGTGAGPQAPFNVCPNGAVGAGPGGCQQIVSNQTTTGPAAGQSATTCTGTSGGCTAAYNVFTGVVNANQVIFNGIPVNPPSTGGIARVFRITNVRANVSALGGGGLAGTTQLLASISISGSTSLPVANPVQIAGFIQSGLSTSLRNAANSGGAGNASLAQCGGGGPNALAIARFSENFATSFKIRTQPSQTIPGVIYNSESGLQIPQTGAANHGLADFGTRLKAVFNNVPAGVRLFVSTTNVINDFQLTVPTGTNFSVAQLVASETGAFAAQPGNTNITIGSSLITAGLAEIQVVNGTAQAVWEVISTNPAAIEGQTTTPTSGTPGVTNNVGTFDFAIYQQFTANPGANSPPVGQATINMSYAPTPPNAFSASAGAVASSTLPIPRFADTSSATNLFQIVLCNTVLLFPFVTNQSGFDTGLAISNTTTDPFGTRNQAGSCTLNFYGASAPPAVNTGNIPTGTTYVTLASTAASGFQGYMIAVCQFQLAHGFAFVSDIGARNLAMGYLALILPDGTGARNNRTEALNN